jgi:hypothetical protein
MSRIELVLVLTAAACGAGSGAPSTSNGSSSGATAGSTSSDTTGSSASATGSASSSGDSGTAQIGPLATCAGGLATQHGLAWGDGTPSPYTLTNIVWDLDGRQVTFDVQVQP